MRTFKKLVLFVLANLLVAWSMTLTLAQPSAVKVLLKEAKGGTYDTLFLGQSHGTMAWNPYIYSSEMGHEALNLNVRLMPLEDVYYILLESDKDRQYDTVILDIDPSYWSDVFTQVGGMDTNLFPHLTGVRQISYLTNVLWDQQWNMALFDYQLTRTGILKSANVLKSKLNLPYMTASVSSLDATYEVIGLTTKYRNAGRGFLYGYHESGIAWPTWKFDASSVREEKIATFEKMVRYCRERNIELVCVQSALPPYRLIHENMDEVHDYFSQLCGAYGVPFIDMNYARGLSRTDGDYVDLDGHMMGQLADRHTKLLCDILKAEDQEQFFFKTYDEVLEGLNCDE